MRNRFLSQKIRNLTAKFILGAMLLGSFSLTDATAQQRKRAVKKQKISTSKAKIRLSKKIEKRDTLQMTEKQRYDRPDEALEFYRKKRLPVGEKELPMEKYLEAKAVIEQMPLYSSVKGRILTEEEREAVKKTGITAENAELLGAWSPLGPGNIGGRTRAIVINPTTPTTMYAAGVAGGVFKTTNGGTSWTAMTDTMANLAVTAMAMQPGAPDTIYAGTGEGFGVADGVRGLGIFKTTNGGTGWAQLPATNNPNFHYVYDVVVSAGTTSNVYASTKTGVFRSTDSGGTWTQVLTATDCTDLAIRTDIPATDTVFVSCGLNAQATIYRNTDAGGAGTWNAVHTNALMQRTSLAIAPSNQAVIYALAKKADHAMQAVYRSTDGGTTWTTRVDSSSPSKLNRYLLTNPFAAALTDCGSTGTLIHQGWYDNVIAVDPSDENRVWTGGIDLFRSDDGGANFGQASNWVGINPQTTKVHADIHNITFHPQYNGTTNKILFAGTDGGVYKTDDARAATATGDNAPCQNPSNIAIVWTNLNNGYGATQFYHGLPYPNGQTYLGGTQDNGTVRGTNAGGQNAWSEILGGDGGYVAVDPTNTNIIYAEFQETNIRKSTDGGTTFSQATNGITVGGIFITPFVMDPSNSQRLWTGGIYMYRTTNGAANWVQASSLLGGDLVTAIAVAPSDPSRVMAGSDGNRIYRTTTALTDDNTTPWFVSQPRPGYVSSVAYHPTNPQIAYATYSNFGGDKVFRSADGGATWAALPGAVASPLPDIPVHSVIVNPANTSQIYIGTDAGVFFSPDEGASWMPENTGFPNTVVESLAITNVGSTPYLFAFTHGRGAWRVALTAPTAASVPISGRVLAGNRGLAKAFVSLTQTDGTTRTVQTNAFGYYRFPEVQAGQTLVITARSKRYDFDPVSVFVSEAIENLNFTAR